MNSIVRLEKCSVSTAASILSSEIEEDVLKRSLFPKHLHHLKSKIVALRKSYETALKSYKKSSEIQRVHVVRFCGDSSNQFVCTMDHEKLEKDPVVNETVESDQSEIDEIEKDPDWEIKQRVQQMKKFVFYSPRVLHLMDRFQIASNSISEILFQIKQDNKVEANISRSALTCRRTSFRKQCLDNHLKSSFPNFLNLHWDGKRMKNQNGEMLERLVITISGPNDFQKFVSLNFIDNGSAQTISKELKLQCDRLKITDKIVTLSYDTTEANSGKTGGAATLFEKLVKKQLNRRPCRLHQKELCVSVPFRKIVMPTVGAGIPIFNRFRNWFIHNNHLPVSLAIDSNLCKPVLEPQLQTLVEFYTKQTKINQRRADHLEVANLALMHLGQNPNYKVKKPGADHHARWLSKVIYIFKMLLFREHFLELDLELTEKFEVFLLYFISIYLKYWFTCESTIHSTKNDLDFLNELEKFSKNNGNYFFEISENVIKTQKRHLQYVESDNAIFSVFDERISIQDKEDLRLKLVGKSNQTQKQTVSKYMLAFNDLIDENEDLIDALDLRDPETEDFLDTFELFEQNFVNNSFEAFEDEFDESDESESGNHSTLNVSDHPFYRIKEESLRSLVNFGININFFLQKANIWDTNSCFKEAVQIAKNIKSTSIFTEQMVGRVSRLHDLSLVRDKHNLEPLAHSVFSFPLKK